MCNQDYPLIPKPIPWFKKMLFANTDFFTQERGKPTGSVTRFAVLNTIEFQILSSYMS